MSVAGTLRELGWICQIGVSLICYKSLKILNFAIQKEANNSIDLILQTGLGQYLS